MIPRTSVATPTLPPLTPRRRTIAFTSGKGGVGKSSLALNTALLLARRGCRVAILDGDLGLASLNVLLGVAPRWDLRHVVRGERRLAEIVLRGPHGLLVIPAGAGVAELAELERDARAGLLDELDTLAASVDYLLIDTGAGIGETVLSLVLAADEAIVVTRPEPTSLADAYAVIKTVLARQATFPFHVLVNMARDPAEGRQVYEGLAQVLLRFLGYRPGYAGHVVSDPVVARAVVDQAPFTIVAPRSLAARSLETLADTLMGTRPPRPAGGARTFWERVMTWTQGAS
jgi:flagellar biosynthesis protein FlhG